MFILCSMQGRASGLATSYLRIPVYITDFFLVIRHQMEVSPFSREVMFQPLSILLQGGVRFFHPPIPAVLSARLAVCFPQVCKTF